MPIFDYTGWLFLPLVLFTNKKPEMGQLSRQLTGLGQKTNIVTKRVDRSKIYSFGVHLVTLSYFVP